MLGTFVYIMHFIWPTPFQTQKDIQGRLRVGSKERLTFFGQAQLNPVHSNHQAIKVRANFSHQLEVSRLHFNIIYYYHYYHSQLPTVWICLYIGGMVIAVSSQQAMQARPLTVYSIVYSRKRPTCDQLTVITVTAAAPLLCCSGGKCMLEPQEQHWLWLSGQR